MTKLEQFKKQLSLGAKQFLEKYEKDINIFFDELDKKGLLKKKFSKQEVERMQHFIRTSNASQHLLNNGWKFFNLDKKYIENNIKILKKLGYKIDNIGDQFGTIICHSNQVFSERLKLHMVTIIDFTKMGLTDADKKPLGSIVAKLKKNFKQNDFVNSLDTNMRNAVTHYTYYFEKGGYIYLCKGYFDKNPIKMTLSEFMIETINLNTITEAFFIIFLDTYFPDKSKLKLDI